eukprot:MONOS_3479.1-p1 / transcript=MONOS_3479.1 / gene=MONOS_3479 / organism=Monocercomonoides_exilis_PA203 / gene_product=unspecified product / transcript_product=unspecified product / location=Mono_scaffold00082:89663-90913(-) / protein_length=391 / sequence_SO=supercontig / SO=protein_coding / is_pseudo=false
MLDEDSKESSSDSTEEDEKISERNNSSDLGTERNEDSQKAPKTIHVHHKKSHASEKNDEQMQKVKKIKYIEYSSSESDSSSSDSSSDETSDSTKQLNPDMKSDSKASDEPTSAFLCTKGEINSGDKLRQIHISGISFNTTKSSIISFLSQFGKISRIFLPTKGDGRMLGYLFCEYEDEKSVDKAVSCTGQILDERPLNISPRQQKAPPPAVIEVSTPVEVQEKIELSPLPSLSHQTTATQPQTAKGSSTLYLGNLPYGASVDALKEFLTPILVECPFVRVRITTEKDTGRSKGYGYVDFGTVEEAETAFHTLSGQIFRGRALIVDYTESRENKRGTKKSNNASFSQGNDRQKQANSGKEPYKPKFFKKNFQNDENSDDSRKIHWKANPEDL